MPPNPPRGRVPPGRPDTGLWPRRHLAWALVALATLALAAEGTLAWRDARLNAQVLARPLPPPPARAEDEAPELRLARALVLAERNDERALALYHPLQDADGDGAHNSRRDTHSALVRAARYNSANLLLRRAEQLRQGPQPGQAIALVELAKQGLRTVLRHTPDDWEARYNLERAQRLQPDPDEESMDPAEGPRRAERAATTMRAFSAGLP